MQIFLIIMNNEDIFKLIGLWREKEALWNMRSPLYKRTDLKSASNEEIASEMCMSVEEVKKKLKSIRTTYVAEKRVDGSKASGTSAEKLYVPNLAYFNEMSFLNQCIIKRQTKDNSQEVCIYIFVIPTFIIFQNKFSFFTSLFFSTGSLHCRLLKNNSPNHLVHGRRI